VTLKLKRFAIPDWQAKGEMMKKLLLSITLLFFSAVAVQAATRVEMKTSMGTITLELNEEQAPISVKNFLAYAEQNFYDGTIFHRVIKNFMIQGGGFDKALQRKQTRPPIKNEAGNGLPNVKGSIAMARTGVVDSATSQFFINLKDNDFLNQRGKSPNMYGYAVFGKVVAGLEIVEKIGRIRTVAKSNLFSDYPEPQVIIESVRRVSE
jgi:cyclophilin family peptidyl-prolyl cis-trans isomerase